MFPHSLDRLGEALVGGRQRDPEEALAARRRTSTPARSRPRPARARARRTTSTCSRPEPAPRRRSSPSARRRRRRSRRARRDDQVATARVDLVHLAERLGRPLERGDAGELNRLEEAGVDVRLQAPVGLDRLGVADDRRAAPAGHVVALREAEDLDADVLGARRLQEARRDVAVVGRLRVGVVVDDEDLVLAGELDDALEQPVGRDRAGRVVRVVEEQQPGPGAACRDRSRRGRARSRARERGAAPRPRRRPAPGRPCRPGSPGRRRARRRPGRGTRSRGCRCIPWRRSPGSPRSPGRSRRRSGGRRSSRRPRGTRRGPGSTGTSGCRRRRPPPASPRRRAGRSACRDRRSRG